MQVRLNSAAPIIVLAPQSVNAAVVSTLELDSLGAGPHTALARARGGAAPAPRILWREPGATARPGLLRRG
ncbi:MAG: hypothetical protein M3O34_08265 [Chloroflexota bacterium]|nr:hypothetical protein [Chloroflexota bacterium]